MKVFQNRCVWLICIALLCTGCAKPVESMPLSTESTSAHSAAPSEQQKVKHDDYDTPDALPFEAYIGDKAISFVPFMNQWNGLICDRMDARQYFDALEDEPQTAAEGETISFDFADCEEPDKVTITLEHGEETEQISYVYEDGVYSFSTNYEGQPVLYARICCTWANGDEIEYAAMMKPE